MNSPLLEKLTMFGLDKDGVETRFIGDAGLYSICFQVLMNDSTFSDLRTALDNSDYMLAFEHAHNLKGSLGNLGLIPLYETACKLVEALRNKDYASLSELISCLTCQMEDLACIVSDLPK